MNQVAVRGCTCRCKVCDLCGEVPNAWIIIPRLIIVFGHLDKGMLEGKSYVAVVGNASASAFGVGIFIGVGDNKIRVLRIVFDGEVFGFAFAEFAEGKAFVVLCAVDAMQCFGEENAIGFDEIGIGFFVVRCDFFRYKNGRADVGLRGAT